jgi:hypothetical protein
VTGDGPKAIFADAVGWLRDRDVLLPGVSRLARPVAASTAHNPLLTWPFAAARSWLAGQGFFGSFARLL